MTDTMETTKTWKGEKQMEYTITRIICDGSYFAVGEWNVAQIEKITEEGVLAYRVHYENGDILDVFDFVRVHKTPVK